MEILSDQPVKSRQGFDGRPNIGAMAAQIFQLAQIMGLARLHGNDGRLQKLFCS